LMLFCGSQSIMPFRAARRRPAATLSTYSTPMRNVGPECSWDRAATPSMKATSANRTPARQSRLRPQLAIISSSFSSSSGTGLW
jgi:hypothetical protein